MSQETRKDKRAPVSLRVRFKSATIDEFIEQYSTDISRGGIFIKSRQPMPVGTLLKFEFQLKDNSPLIQGVGRVVWKRDQDATKPDVVPGMGIKFIKMSPESRAVVERIVGGKEDVAPGADEAATRVANVSEVMAKGMKPEVAAPPPSIRAPAAPRAPAPDDHRKTPVEGTPAVKTPAVGMPAVRTPAVRSPAAGMPAVKTPAVRSPAAGMPAVKTPAMAKEPASAAQPDDEPTQLGVGVPGKQVPAEAADRGATDVAEPLGAVQPPGAIVVPEAKKEEAAAAAAAPPEEEDWEPEAPAEPEEKAPAVEPAAVAAPAKPEVEKRPVAKERRGTSAVLWVAIVVVLGGIGAGSWWFLGRGGAPDVGPEGGSDTQPVVATVVDAGAPEPVDAGPPPPAATAKISVTSDPEGASVFVESVERGVTPLEVSVAPGRAAQIEVQLVGYEVVRREVTPSEGEPTVVDAGRLRPTERVLVVTSTPEGADVVVGGRRRGRTPTRVSLYRLDKAVDVTFVLRGHLDFTTTVDAVEGWQLAGEEWVHEVSATLAEVERRPDEPRERPRPREERPGPGETAAPGTAAPPPQTAAPPPQTAAPPPQTAAPPPRTAAPLPDNPFG